MMDQADELRRKGLGNLAILHDHLLSYITFLLDLEDVVRLSCCSRVLRVFACEEPLWLGLCLKLHDGLVEYKANWRQTALANYTARPVTTSAIQAAARPLPPLPGLSSAFLYRRWYRCHVDLRGFLPPPEAPTVERLPAAAMTPAEFAQRFDAPCMPVLLGGMQDSWPAASWSLPALCAAFPSARFKVAKPHGGRALMTLPAYVDYMARQADEEPLYVFDAAFAEAAPGMRRLYEVPHVFSQDFFSHLGGGRPHYRWLVLGPARAGASWHVDPSLTSAWNALLSGRKRWALYPPHIRPPGVALDDDGEESHPDDDNLTSLQWFLEVYPGLPPERRPIEFIQNPGEVVFVPGGWWHCVLNLETAVAVTQNFVSDANLPRVVRYMAHGSSRYMARPLPYYDGGREVAAWAAAYPAVMAAARSDDSDDEEGDEDQGDQWDAMMEEDGDEKGKDEKEGCKVRALRVLPAAALAADGCRSRAAAGATSGAGERGGWADFRANGTPANGFSSVHGAAAAAAAVADESGGHGDAASGGPQVAADAVLGVAWRSDLEYQEVAVWRRHRPLGRWLRRLWERQPETRPAIQECLAKYLHGGFWREVLRGIASQLPVAPQRPVGDPAPGHQQERQQPLPGAPATAPSPLEVMPLMGADAMVFLYGDLAVKIFTHEVPAVRGLMCALEGCAPQLLLLQQQQQQPATVDGTTKAATAPEAVSASTRPLPRSPLPQPLACGAIAVTLTRLAQDEPGEAEDEATGGKGERGGPEDGAGKAAGRDGRTAEGKGQMEAAGSGGEAVEQELLYVVQQRLQEGLHELQDVLDSRLDPDQLGAVAEALGHLVGSMHANTAASTAAKAAVSVAPAAAAPAVTADAGSEAARLPGDGDLASWARLVRTAAVWHDRSGNIWVSGLGLVSAAPGEAGDGEDGPSAGGRTPGSSTAAEGQPAAAATAAAVAAATPGGADGDAGPFTWACDVPVSCPWWPFVQHLRSRQRELLRSLQHWAPEAEWPGWVRQQLPSYLPADPAELLGFMPSHAGAGSGPVTTRMDTEGEAATAGGNGSSSGSGSEEEDDGPGASPVLLHGDITAHNVAIRNLPPGGPRGSSCDFDTSGCHDGTSGDGGTGGSLPGQQLVGGSGGGGSGSAVWEEEPWRPQLRLVDFSDAGHGDPLYDFLPVYGSCTAADESGMVRFWAAYRRHVDPGRLWPRRRRIVWEGGGDSGDGDGDGGRLRLSYVAMCYSLLHEEAEVMLQRVWGGEGKAVAPCGAREGSGAGGVCGEETGVGQRSGGAGEGKGGEGAWVGEAGGKKTLEALAVAMWGFLDAD